MWSDNETHIDYLNHSEIAELVCEMISDKSLHPLSVGIYGGWGIGKSSVLRFIREEQEKGQESIVIEFDAWLYQGFDEAKSALMTVIAQQLILEAPECLKDKAIELFKRTNKLKLLGLSAEVGMAALGLPAFGFISKAADSARDAISGNGGQEDLETLRDGIEQTVARVDGLFGAKGIQSAPEEITAFKKEYSLLLRELGKTLVVFVDNLDRCLPKNAIQNLEAMRLFMSLPSTVVVVAADVDMIRHAVTQEFSGPSKKHVDDYLDKLIHFPVTVPRLGLQEVQAFLTMLIISRSSEVNEEECELVRKHLISKIRNSWSDDSGISLDGITELISSPSIARSQIDAALRMAPILARSKSILGNPRIIKRLMNVVSMRHSLAKRRGMQLDESTVMKLSLFERCTNGLAFADFLEIVNAAPDGMSDLLSSINLGQIEDSLNGYPDSWGEHIQFIKEWGALYPDFSKINLRPAVYLARETLPIQIRNLTLSSDGVAAVTGLLRIKSRTSQHGAKLIKSIPTDERAMVMSELINSLRQNSDWASRRNDLSGAILLGEMHVETRKELTEFLRAIPSPAAWLKALIEDLEKENS